MKTLSHILLLGLSLLLLTVADTAQAQDRNPTVYPYGCVPDSSLRQRWLNRDPVRCGKADFREVSFESRADFREVSFESRADFIRASFDSLAYFSFASFDSLANFSFASFDSQADFSGASFDSRADFSFASFDSQADFSFASFDSRAYFSRAEINDHITFLSADLLGSVDFRFARFDSAAVATFHRTNLGDSLLLGDSLSLTLPHFDFTRANLLSAGEKKSPPLYS